MTRVRSGLTLAALAAAATSALAVAVPVQATAAANGMENIAPVRPANQDMTRSGQFVLNGNNDLELMRLASPRNVEICLPEQMDVTARPELQGAEAYGVIVASDKEAAEIQPGDCITMNAAKLSVRPASGMPEESHVVGNVHIH